MSRPLAKYLASATVLAFALLGAAAAPAAGLPTYEVSSLPATPVQLSVFGTSRARAEEQSPAATLTRGGMPATPLQLSVLTSHRRSASADAKTTVGAARN